MQRRPAHKLAHAQCPYGVFNWADCDTAAARQWGHCKALVKDKQRNEEPHECSNWAADEGGYCDMHFSSRYEKDMKAARQAERQLQLVAGIGAFIAMTAEYPSMFDRPLKLSTSAESTRGLRGIEAGQPPATHPSFSTAKASSAAPRPRKLPHAIRVGKQPHRLTELA